MAEPIIERATVSDVELVAPLFDAYRQFYGRSGDLDLARRFLRERLEKHESIVLIARANDGAAAGFTQLYPSFSSVSAARTYVLNDLFVVPSMRRRGAATALLRAAADFARSYGAVRLTLSTAITNTTAQAVYEAEGWQRDTVFYVYNLPLTAPT